MWTVEVAATWDQRGEKYIEVNYSYLVAFLLVWPHEVEPCGTEVG